MNELVKTPTNLPFVVLLQFARVFVWHDDFAGANVVVNGGQKLLGKILARINPAVIVDKILQRHRLLVFGIVLVH